jgi:sugar/nucleoside kinase (ribokinase family)
MMDLFAIGDPTIDTFVKIHDAEVHCELKKNSQCMMCIDYGEKLPVDTIQQKTAGNAMNVAIGGARLGLSSALVAFVGEDMAGQHIVNALKKDKVKTTWVEKDKKNGTNASTVVSFQGERSILVYHAPRTYKLPVLPKAKWVYYTSVGKGHEKLNKDVVSYIKKSGAKLAYNPGTYQILAGAEEVKKVAAHCEIMFVNKEEAARIFGEAGSIQESLHKMVAAGVHTPVITDGQNGSYAFDGTTTWSMGMYPFKAVERTGAGDSYATGFMCARAYGLDVPTAMQWGAANSTGVVLKVGPQDGLMTKKELIAFLNKPECKRVKPSKV